MKVVLVEDEIAASDNLTFLLKKIDSNINIIKVLDSVKSSIDYFSRPHEAELIFMDIHLADGVSFEIFEKTTITTPIIFTTAFDQYALKAFKFNSIDYLLKPIGEDELKDALKQFTNSRIKKTNENLNMEGLLNLIKSSQQHFKTTYLVHFKDELIPLKITDIAYFYIDSGLVKAITLENQSYIIDKTLEDIENEINPEIFFRVNRQFIVNKDIIQSMSYYFNSKMIVKTKPISKERIIVSKAKSRKFKQWLNN